MNPLPSQGVNLRIVATGQCFPAQVVTAAEIDARTGMAGGWTSRRTGVETRHHVGCETAPGMGAAALRDAMARTVGYDVVPDLLIGASGTPHQPIPCTAAMVAGELGWSEVACFDLNATCLSFVAALQVAAGMFATGQYRRIAIVSTEIASKGLNWKQPEAAGLMGDGAAAAVLEPDPDGESALLRWAMETWPEGAAHTEIRGGGSRIPAIAHRPGENSEDFLFHMDGPAVFKLAAEKIGRFVDGLIGTDANRWDGIDWVVPHQASVSGLRRLGRRLGIPGGKMIQTVRTQGNVIAASIPLALHEAITSGRLRRGQTVLLLGTSAGFSLGGAVLRY